MFLYGYCSESVAPLVGQPYDNADYDTVIHCDYPTRGQGSVADEYYEWGPGVSRAIWAHCAEVHVSKSAILLYGYAIKSAQE